VMKIVLWSLLGLLILENLTGIRVDTLIASLGVAGVAVALAVQKILGDLFASLSIALDKPFVIGDAINVGDFTGTVEYIGLKSTRLRSLTGEQVIISNSDLLGSRIRNYKRMERRLVILPLGVACNTPQEKLAAVPGMIQEIVEKQDQVTFSRAHLKSLGDFTINFEVVYFLETPDYMRFMDAQQAILLAILERFEQENINIPFPTQAVLLEK
jgi:MscS family membrane protein